MTRFVTIQEAGRHLIDRRVAIVGSGPSSRTNEPGFVDSHDVVFRVNNYKCGPEQGLRTDVFYSFFGNSIKKTSDDLQRDGVRLCMCKLPNSQPLESDWHRAHGKLAGIDYRYIYANRKGWWFCETFIPNDDQFMAKFELLGKHQPTTGFAGILDVLACKPRSLFLTGFDFFTSGLHNVDEPWRQKNTSDPIGHRPDLEAQWLRDNAAKYPLSFDSTMTSLLFERAAA